MATAAQVRCFRHQKGLSQEDLALQAGLNPAYLGQVERGEKCPTVDTLYKISSALDISLSELLRFESSTDLTEDALDRMKALFSRFPVDKIDPVLKTVESIVALL